MSGHEPQEGGFEITPEEERFLRAFFRRHAGRYLALAGALGAATVCAAWALGGSSSEAEATRAEFAAFRADNHRLRAEVSELKQRIASLEQGVAQMGSLEKRVAGALRRLERVESQVEATSADAGSVEAAASWDVGSILERLYNLEMRQARAEQRAGSAQPLPAAPLP